MISGIHTLIYSKDAKRAREFFKDVLELPSVDAGEGWLIFALPPAELAIHPTEGKSYHELYFMCEDIKETTDKLKKKGIKIIDPITDRGWGLVTRIKLRSGDEFGLYQPKHPAAIGLKPSRNN